MHCGRILYRNSKLALSRNVWRGTTDPTLNNFSRHFGSRCRCTVLIGRLVSWHAWTKPIFEIDTEFSNSCVLGDAVEITDVFSCDIGYCENWSNHWLLNIVQYYYSVFNVRVYFLIVLQNHFKQAIEAFSLAVNNTKNFPETEVVLDNW